MNQHKPAAASELLSMNKRAPEVAGAVLSRFGLRAQGPVPRGPPWPLQVNTKIDSLFHFHKDGNSKCSVHVKRPGPRVRVRLFLPGLRQGEGPAIPRALASSSWD